jgi:hypothetical protein
MFPLALQALHVIIILLNRRMKPFHSTFTLKPNKSRMDTFYRQISQLLDQTLTNFSML